MKCAHCLENFFENFSVADLKAERGERMCAVQWANCPACGKHNIFLIRVNSMGVQFRNMVYPKAMARAPLTADVEQKYAGDYSEACLVLADSAKASAALSRRTLQLLLRDKAGVKPSDLSKEIDQVLASGKLPSQLADAIDAIRNIGNFAAHPLKSTCTGEILEVETGEAEWLLDVLEGMFDFYFVQPAILQRKKEALNKKLAEAGKLPMK